MIEEHALLILTLLVSALASWVIYLLYRVQDIKEDVRVAKVMSEYYKEKVVKYEAKMLRIKEELKDD